MKYSPSFVQLFLTEICADNLLALETIFVVAFSSIFVEYCSSCLVVVSFSFSVVFCVTCAVVVFLFSPVTVTISSLFT